MCPQDKTAWLYFDVAIQKKKGESFPFIINIPKANGIVTPLMLIAYTYTYIVLFNVLLQELATYSPWAGYGLQSAWIQPVVAWWISSIQLSPAHPPFLLCAMLVIPFRALPIAFPALSPASIAGTACHHHHHCWICLSPLPLKTNQ